MSSTEPARARYHANRIPDVLARVPLPADRYAWHMAARLRSGQSLRDKAYVALRAKIMSGALAQGALLSEADEASQLGMSRSPVREAIQVLAREGLVDVLPKRGTLVVRLSAKDARQSFELREAIETTAARLAAERRTPAQLEAMRRALGGEKDAPAAGDGRYERGATFHDGVVAAADNPFLEEAFNLAAGRIELVSRQATVRAAKLPKGARHEDILTAIERGQGEVAERAMRAHLAHHLEELIESLT